MLLGKLSCAVGRHRVDRKAIRHVHGMAVGRCRDCRTPLEQVTNQGWSKLVVHDAGLGFHNIR